MHDLIMAITAFILIRRYFADSYLALAVDTEMRGIALN